MMATYLDSFDGSQVGGFVESRLGARNLGLLVQETRADVVIIIMTSGTRLYHPLSWAIQQSGQGEDPRTNLGEGDELANDQYRRDSDGFAVALGRLGEFTSVAVGLVYAPFFYDASYFTWPFDGPSTRFTSDAAKIQIVASGGAFPGTVRLTNRSVPTVLSVQQLHAIVLSLAGVPILGSNNLVYVTAGAFGYGDLIAGFHQTMAHVLDTTGALVSPVFDVNFAEPLESNWFDLVVDWKREHEASLAGLVIEQGNGTWLRLATRSLELALNAVRP